MPLEWHQSNLETHVAKHFIGDVSEGWRELLGPVTAAKWDVWRLEAGAGRCRLDEHPEKCRDVTACGPVHHAAGEPYEGLVAAEWAFVESRDFIVRYRDEKNTPCVCGAGPRGIFVAAVDEADGRRIAKTAFRPVQRSRSGHNVALGGVRKMKPHASLGAGGWSVNDLVRLETLLLLGPRGPGEPRFVSVAKELTALPPKDLP